MSASVSTVLCKIMVRQQNMAGCRIRIEGGHPKGIVLMAVSW